jgi:hypothetical protein
MMVKFNGGVLYLVAGGSRLQTLDSGHGLIVGVLNIRVSRPLAEIAVGAREKGIICVADPDKL